MFTWLTSLRRTWTPSRDWWPPVSSRGLSPNKQLPSSSPVSIPPAAILCLQVHPPCEEDGVCSGTRLHHGDLSGRQSHRLWWHSLQADLGQHVGSKQSASWHYLIAVVVTITTPLSVFTDLRVCWQGWTASWHCLESPSEEIQITSDHASTSSIPSRYKHICILHWKI